MTEKFYIAGREELMIAAAALLCTTASLGTAGREELSFNFGWRFHLGDAASATPRCVSTPAEFDTPVFPPCTNMLSAPLESASDCRKACCPGSAYHPGCTVWSFFDKRDPGKWTTNYSSGGGCYLGGSVDEKSAVCHAKPNETNIKSWVGGRRTTPWPTPPTPAFAAAEFDDSAWRTLNVPHDFVIEGDFSSNVTDGGKHGYLKREQPGWYRKHFTVPSDWLRRVEGDSIWLRFDGVFHITEAFLDGVAIKLGRGSKSGYTSFTTSDLGVALRTGGGNHNTEHVLALRVDASFGSGHWYEGGGIYRNTWILTAPSLHVANYGLFVPTIVADDRTDSTSSSSSRVVNASVEIVNSATSATTGVVKVSALWTMWENFGDRKEVGKWSSAPVVAPPAGGTLILRKILQASSGYTPKLWTIQDSKLYTVGVEIVVNAVSIDAVNATTGFRSAKFHANTGFALNGKRVILRGFSNHNSFAGVGVAVPLRVNLYRVQMARAMGANSWRMTHNAGDPEIYELFDRLGLLIWDENRDYGAYQSGDMADMVRRDRNHPSIAVWSMCNEDECFEQDPAVGNAYREVALAEDYSRPLSGNLLHDSSGSMVDHFDVVGVSHGSTLPAPWTPMPASWFDKRYSYEWFHAHHPTIPLLASEGSSCNTQRGVNVVNIVNNTGEFDDVHNADCLSKLFCHTVPGTAVPNVTKATVEVLDGGAVMHNPGLCTQAWTTAYYGNGTILPFFSGNLGIWTLFDYIGEPNSRNRGFKGLPEWPQKSSNFGSFDLAGFPKPAAFHYRSWWLANIPADAEGRPSVCGSTGTACDVVKIVHDWREPMPPIVAVYSNLPTIELFFNGKSLGKQTMSFANWTEWTSDVILGGGGGGGAAAAFTPGTLRAVGYNAAGKAVASESYTTPKQKGVYQLLLSVDVPSAATGTGTKLVLDGADTAMLRVSIVDSSGQLVSGGADAALNVSFRIKSGPGQIVGVGNGNPTCHEHNKQDWRTTYHGLARVLVRTTIDAATKGRSRRGLIDVEGGVIAEEGSAAAQPIIVEATSPGYAAATVMIQTSTDIDVDGVLAVAERSQHVVIKVF